MLEDLFSIGGWSPVTIADEPLYTSYFARSNEPYSYENNWGFITQEIRLWAAKYQVDGMLLTAVIKATDSPYIFILPPSGDTSTFSKQIGRIAVDLSAISGRRVVLRKVSAKLCQELSTNQFIRLSAE